MERETDIKVCKFGFHGECFMFLSISAVCALNNLHSFKVAFQADMVLVTEWCQALDSVHSTLTTSTCLLSKILMIPLALYNKIKCFFLERVFGK